MALMPFFSTSIFDPFFDFSDQQQQGQQQQQQQQQLGRCQQFARDVSAVANTRVDWMETAEAHVFKADLPGLSKDEIKITVEDARTLQIAGERKKEEVQKSDKYHRIERAHGSFLRRFRLPHNANVEAIKADVKDGVLTVTVPKMEKPKPRPVQIQ